MIAMRTTISTTVNSCFPEEYLRKLSYLLLRSLKLVLGAEKKTVVAEALMQDWEH